MTAFGARRFLFLDDNPIAHPEAAKEMLRALIPLRVQWVSQATINVARDPELLDLVARSGARVLSIGFESLSDESLASVVEAVQSPEPLQGGHREAARARHPGDRAPHGRASTATRSRPSPPCSAGSTRTRSAS